MKRQIEWHDTEKVLPPFDHISRYHLVRLTPEMKGYGFAVAHWNGVSWGDFKRRDVMFWGEVEDPAFDKDYKWPEKVVA